jgi:HK97 family phage prohead protease
MDIAGLREELRRVETRIAELDSSPIPSRDLAREATDLALRGIAEKRIVRADFRVGSVEKFLSSGKRTVRGIASSASVDRVGDIVVPSGGKWRLPVIMLYQHRHDSPVGWVRSLQVKGNELHFEAEIATGIGEADRVWEMVDGGLLQSCSIGFRALSGGTEIMPGGGIKFTSWELLELSVVSVPVNPDARLGPAKAPAPIKLVSPYDRGAVRLIRPEQKPVKLLTPAQIRQHQWEKDGIPIKKPGYQHGVTPLKTQVKPSGGIPLIKPGQ